MADDDRDFIERADSMNGKLYGKPASIDQIADDFALYGLKKRAATLEDFDAELRGEIDSGSHSLRRRVQLMTLRKKMGGVHEALRKAKREKAMTNPVLAALAQARMRAAPMFARWCELNGASWCPAAPADVAKFVTDCASLGIERLWPAVQEISKDACFVRARRSDAWRAGGGRHQRCRRHLTAALLAERAQAALQVAAL